ncbi:short-chain dehydrogenase/reductase SDR [Paraglaciecola sp. T6c]|uniref:SDR family NAD(P)-dependent oxidoreductase n=1 Tax=Pseudoalteromonas atlantica (strain T6c / ATCC BAA-1087) TaxID=3042615 RepID=UPI00005C75A5|nr:SDR family oxidoreductase [Paraglaciecola sp. T6c]ABG41577.1 short-chain dehydrogenase/reductase SDR [Paraglaciecola sp. T6c]
MSEYVIVTGASRGLGLAICRDLLDSGVSVVALARTYSPELHSLSDAYPDCCHFIEADLADLDALPALCKSIVKRFGRPYGLVNNAAVGHDGVLATMPNGEIDNLMRLNVQSPMLLSKYLLRSMLLNRRGRIINISSIIAKTGFNGLSVYAASKAALEGFSKSLAREVGKAGITVNCVAPGYMQTDMTGDLQGEKLASIKRRSPLGRLASVEDAAAMVSFLLSDKGSAITGTVMTVDAGSTA